jgi:hypothetical protein
VAIPLPDLPRFLVLEPVSTVRVEMQLNAPACEIDVELDNPAPGRSFVLLIGHKEGPFVQRVRLAGRARIYFDPQSPGEYVLLFANPQKEPIVLRLKARNVGQVVPKVKVAAPSRRPPGRKHAAPHRTPTKARTNRPATSRRR